VRRIRRLRIVLKKGSWWGGHLNPFKRNRDAQEGCRNRCGFLARALVLAVEQFFKPFLQISDLTVLLRHFEGIHGGPIVFSEFVHERLRGAWIVKRKRVPGEGDFLGGNSRAAESQDHVALDAPRHRADKAFWRWRRVGGTDLQNLRHQRRIAWNPVAHNDSSPRASHAHHLFGDLKRLGREHRAKDAHDEIKRLPRHLMQIRRITFLEPAIDQAKILGPLVPSRNQVARDINAKNLRSEFCRGYGRRSIATAKVQNLEAV
jgi:hypothetical protein